MDYNNLGIINDSFAAASQAVSAVVAMIQARKAAAAAREEQRKRDAFNEQMFKRQYYEDALSRTDTQNMLRNYRETLRDAIRKQENTAVVTGETPEAIAATKANNAKAYANAVAGIAAQNSARKDAALANYQNAKNSSYGDWIKSYMGDAQNWSNFASQAFRTGASQIGGMGSGNANAGTPSIPGSSPGNIYDYAPASSQSPLAPPTGYYA